MPRKRAKSADQKSLGTPGTTETAGALRRPPRGLRGTPPSAIVRAVPEFIWGMSGSTSWFPNHKKKESETPKRMRLRTMAFGLCSVTKFHASCQARRKTAHQYW